MSIFPLFEEYMGEPSHCSPVDSKTLEFYKDKLPDLLLKHWSTVGWCAYANGFIWIVNPGDFTHVSEEWFNGALRSALVFARTGFGDMFLWLNNQVYILRVHDGWKHTLTKSIDIFFDITLSSDEYVGKGLRKTLFDKAVSKFGVLEADECYAPVPALALGGKFSLRNLQKVKLHEHLSFLGQLHSSA